MLFHFFCSPQNKRGVFILKGENTINVKCLQMQTTKNFYLKLQVGVITQTRGNSSGVTGARRSGISLSQRMFGGWAGRIQVIKIPFIHSWDGGHWRHVNESARAPCPGNRPGEGRGWRTLGAGFLR